MTDSPGAALLAVASVATAATDGTMRVLAESPPWPEWIALPANLSAIVLLGWLFFTGRMKRKEDCEAAVAAERALCDEQINSATRDARMARERLEGVLADRDAWRSAHAAEVEARREAEASARALLEAQSVTVQLLGTIDKMLTGKGGDHVGPGSTY